MSRLFDFPHFSNAKQVGKGVGKGATDFCYLLVLHDVFESSLLVAKSLSGIVSEENEVENKPVL